jgi:hypothetical protein
VRETKRLTLLWCRNDVVTIGQVPAELIHEASDGKVNEPWPAQINKLVRA